MKNPSYAEIVAPHAAAMRMVRDAIGELFGPTASLESEEAVLLRGPEPQHDAEAIIEALQRVHAAAPASAAEPVKVKTCGLDNPSYHDCTNMQEVGGGMDGERYRCAVCGKSYFLDYEEMK